MKCFLDLDGVIVDFVAGVCRAHGVPNVYDDARSLGQFEMPELMGLTPAEFWAPVDQHFWASLGWTADGREMLAMLEEQFGQENICILTSPNKAHDAATGKMQWIAEHLPAYRRRFFIGPEKYFCAHGNALLVDDYDKNVDAFRVHGGSAVLVPRRWNSLNKLADFSVGHVHTYLNSFTI